MDGSIGRRAGGGEWLLRLEYSDMGEFGREAAMGARVDGLGVWA